MIESSVLSLFLLVLLLENSIRSQLQIAKDKVIPITPVADPATDELGSNAASKESPQHKVEAASVKAEEKDEHKFPSSQRELLAKIEEIELSEEVKDEIAMKKKSDEQHKMIQKVPKAVKGVSKKRKLKKDHALNEIDKKNEFESKKGNSDIEAIGPDKN
eukprot:TRINITY_DN2070_c0_g3_i1.p1 TRINITY_DN2070_c0_g3~~TRINITY_DN2070_c0_g3_i1.p1  ORF type:complete len:160 (+),score=35.08 TRINITY_DN2070_c0_g3_i1:140-619(+)